MTEVQPILDLNERIFTLSDVVRLFRKQRLKLMKILFIAAVGIFAYKSFSPAKYRMEATFKEGAEKSGSDGLLKDFLIGASAGAQTPQAVGLMKSYRVLKPLIQRLGLQATVPRSQWIIGKVLQRVRENFRAEMGKPLQDLDPFVFENVVYEAEDKLRLDFCFKNKNEFVLITPQQRIEGKLGEEVSVTGLKLTLVKTPKSLRIGSEYPLEISSWESIAKKLRNELQINNDKVNKSIYNLAIHDRDRWFGVRLLNELMNEYQGYLKRDHDELAQEQLGYLENRQEQLYGNMKGMLDEYTVYLTKNLSEKGFVGLDQEVESLLIPYQKMLNRVLEIEINLGKLNSMHNGDLLVIDGENQFSANLRRLVEGVHSLKQRRDLLGISLQKNYALTEDEHHLELRRRELKEIRTRREGIQQVLETIDREDEIEPSAFNFNQPLFCWAQTIQDAEKGDEKEDFADYLENYVRVLSIREKVLQECFFYRNTDPSELEGIDLDTAEKLFLSYNEKLDKTEASIGHYNRLKNEVQLNDFELGSLSSILTDPLSQSVIEQANQVVLKLKDEKYHSSKEDERWRSELDLQRKIIVDHLDQLLKIEELNSELVREKLTKLQQISLDCINNEISVLHARINDNIENQRKSFLQEKEILDSKMLDIRKQAMDLPQKWRLEKWMDLKSEIGVKMMESLTEVVESKTIGHHLHHIESKPLDFAILPVFPIKPGLFALAALGAFLAGFVSFLYSLLQQILKGFPLSPEKLQALNLPYLGPISTFCDGPLVEALKGPDLELLRQLALFVEKSPQGRVVGLIGGRGPDYSYAFAENLARISHKSIILRCDFGAKFREKDLPGLLQIWKGEIGELPIRKGKSYDVIMSGGYSPFGAEVIQSPAFKQLVDVLKKNYDSVFLLTRVPLESSESKSILRLSDQAIVTVTEEQTEILTPFADWAYHERNCRLTFITSNT